MSLTGAQKQARYMARLRAEAAQQPDPYAGETFPGEFTLAAASKEGWGQYWPYAVGGGLLILLLIMWLLSRNKPGGS